MFTKGQTFFFKIILFLALAHAVPIWAFEENLSQAQCYNAYLEAKIQVKNQWNDLRKIFPVTRDYHKMRNWKIENEPGFKHIYYPYGADGVKHKNEFTVKTLLTVCVDLIIMPITLSYRSYRLLKKHMLSKDFYKISQLSKELSEVNQNTNITKKQFPYIYAIIYDKKLSKYLNADDSLSKLLKIYQSNYFCLRNKRNTIKLLTTKDILTNLKRTSFK